MTTLSNTARKNALLDPGMDLTLRPMRYPLFYERFRDAIKNTWTVEEVDLHSDLADLGKLSEAERHLVNRLVAFFATGDTIVANNLVLNLYEHVNAPEARLYLSRQLFEEAVHVQFYLTLLDTYLPDPEDRAAAFAAVENIPSIREKAQFCFRWMDSVEKIDQLETKEDRRPIRVIDQAKVEKFKSSAGRDPRTMNLAAAGKELGADYVIDLTLNSMSIFQPEFGREFYQGRAQLQVVVWDTDKPDAPYQDYFHPSIGEQKSTAVLSPAGYRKYFLGRVAIEVAHRHIPHVAVRELPPLQ